MNDIGNFCPQFEWYCVFDLWYEWYWEICLWYEWLILCVWSLVLMILLVLSPEIKHAVSFILMTSLTNIRTRGKTQCHSYWWQTSPISFRTKMKYTVSFILETILTSIIRARGKTQCHSYWWQTSPISFLQIKHTVSYILVTTLTIIIPTEDKTQCHSFWWQASPISFLPEVKLSVIHSGDKPHQYHPYQR